MHIRPPLAEGPVLVPPHSVSWTEGHPELPWPCGQAVGGRGKEVASVPAP